ncbi:MULTISPECIES: hypothetical protein [Sphingomonas]|nr:MULTISPECIES: hypothetical protein [Sphingomonas]
MRDTTHLARVRRARYIVGVMTHTPLTTTTTPARPGAGARVTA